MPNLAISFHLHHNNIILLCLYVNIVFIIKWFPTLYICVLVNKKILWIKERRAYRDGIKRKGDKIGMVSVVSSKMRMVSEELDSPGVSTPLPISSHGVDVTCSHKSGNYLALPFSTSKSTVH